MKKNEMILAGAVFLLALLLRCYDFTYPDFLWGDEKAHVPAATNYWLNGQFEPDNWEHPPLRHIIEYGFLQIFGDNPYGWRMRNVLFGALAAALTCIFAHHVTNSRKTALLAGLFLATDPLHIVLSRYTFEEVYGGAFFLMALILYMKHNQRSFMFILSAVFMGCALATKWYYAPCWLTICFLALREKNTYRQGGAAVFVATTYLLIPAGIFIISYYNWFGRGYSFTEFIEFIVNAYYSLQKYRPQNYHSGMIFLSHPSSLEWFTRPVMVGQGTYFGQNSGEFIMYVNSLPIWILTLPSMAWSWHACLEKAQHNPCLPRAVLLFILQPVSRGQAAGIPLFGNHFAPVFIYSYSLCPLSACGQIRHKAFLRGRSRSAGLEHLPLPSRHRKESAGCTLSPYSQACRPANSLNRAAHKLVQVLNTGRKRAAMTAALLAELYE